MKSKVRDTIQVLKSDFVCMCMQTDAVIVYVQQHSFCVVATFLGAA